MAARRLFPGCSTKAYKQQGGQWVKGDPNGNLATVTAIVTIAGGGAQPYMLTAGHAFRDCDENNSILLAPAAVNNLTFPPPAPLPNGQPPISWGENRMPLGGAPYANGFQQYHCAGDKLDNGIALNPFRVDAGLAILVPGLAAATWNNVATVNGQAVTLNAFDAWPPVLPAGQQYFLGISQVATGPAPAGLNARANFTVGFPTWNGAPPAGILDRVMVTSTRHNTTPGVSGYPLVRMPVPNPAGTAILVGMMIGLTKDAANPADPNEYEVYQHISQVVAMLNVNGFA